ncbi:MAG: cob(I)yrinic acid a,c-diamide adenosyltransferase [Anaerovoracaceae bacterium]|jgi:cob(I)alamin adenosyltransferase
MLKKGYIQVYTGNGKGKTTAALGLSLRSVCAGNKVFFGQFMKGQECSEKKAQLLLPGFTFEQFGNSDFIAGTPTEKDISCAEQGLKRIREVLVSEDYDIVVLDEINTALFFKLISVEEVLSILAIKPERTELVLTGRYAPPEIIDCADLVTEMNEIKHYYNIGVDDRIGIEN